MSIFDCPVHRGSVWSISVRISSTVHVAPCETRDVPCTCSIPRAVSQSVADSLAVVVPLEFFLPIEESSLDLQSMLNSCNTPRRIETRCPICVVQRCVPYAMHFVSWYRHRAYVENYPLVVKETDGHDRERERERWCEAFLYSPSTAIRRLRRIKLMMKI